MSLKIALLTSCSVTRNFEPIVRIQDVPVFDTMTELCQWWVDAMRGAATNKGNLKTPGELYAGIAFTAVTEIAQDIGHDNIFIVTGGTGMSRHTDKIVPYDFTVAKGEEYNAHQHVTGEKFLPHVWWEKINGHLHHSNTPVTKLLEKYDIIVSALPKAFLKYLISDLKNISPEDLRDRVFLPIPRSMIGSFPKALHGAFVPYGAEYTEDLNCSRYDKAQRVAQKFIKHCTTRINAEKHAAEIIKSSTTLAVGVGGNGILIDYDALFGAYPQLLETDDVGIAIRQGKMLGLKMGSKQQFAGAWRGAKGPMELEMDKDEEAKALIAMEELLLKPSKNTPFLDEELLHQIGVYVASIKQLKPDMIFVAADIAAWGRMVYEEDSSITRTSKITHVLSYHTRYLSIEPVVIGTTKGYRVL